VLPEKKDCPFVIPVVFQMIDVGEARCKESKPADGIRLQENQRL
jgi:hypothetical protein